MRVSSRFLMLASAGYFGFVGGLAQADGLADLKSALTRLRGQAPLKAVLEVKAWSRSGEGGKHEETGQVSLALEDDGRGLQVLYGKDLLARAESEERAKGKDPKAKTPTLFAMTELDPATLRPMVSAAGELERSIEESVFKGEKAESYNGKPARHLSFEMPIDKLPEKDRKYVKQFENSLDIWIAADGTPLASTSRQRVSGRAFVVISFEQNSDEERVYGLLGDRLLTVRKESKSSTAGAGEKGEQKVVRTLQLQS